MPQMCYQPDMAQMLAAQQAAFMMPQLQHSANLPRPSPPKRQAKVAKAAVIKQSQQVSAVPAECSNCCPSCGANSWHNLRVRKSKMSLRCTSCSKSLNYNKDYIWNKLRCPEFHATNGVCTNGSKCERMHIHYYKEPANASESSLNLAGFQQVFTKPIMPQSCSGEQKKIEAEPEEKAEEEQFDEDATLTILKEALEASSGSE